MLHLYFDLFHLGKVKFKNKSEEAFRFKLF